MALVEIIVTIIGSIMGAMLFPQAYKIFKRKSAGDISIYSFSYILFGTAVWVFYGIYISAYPIVISNGLSFIATLFIVIGWFKYGRNP
jgi:MtN3 and saliva related transmembrane protein